MNILQIKNTFSNLNVNTNIRFIYITLSLLFLLFGIFIYVIFRPTTLIVFDWLKIINLNNFAMFLRFKYTNLSNILPYWVIYSLPFVLWIISYLFLIEAIWIKSKNTFYLFWFCIVPIISIGSEMLQLFGLIQGVFSYQDLMLMLISCFFSYYVFSSIKYMEKL